MVAKKNFTPYKKPFKAANQIFLNASQMPDNPGYMDFNNMDFPQAQGTNKNDNPVPNQNNSQTPKKRNPKAKQKFKNQPPMQPMQPMLHMHQQTDFQNNGAWRKNTNSPHGNKNGNNRNFFANPQQRVFHPGNNGPVRGMGAGRVRVMQPNGRIPGPLPPPPHGFQRSPMVMPMPPPPHMRPPLPNIGMQPPAPPFLRRNRNRQPGNGKPGFPGPMPPPMLSPMQPLIPPGPPIPRMPLHFNGAPNSNGKIKKHSPKVVKKMVKSKSTIKTLKNLQNQFPLEKPWVTDTIREEHQKKVEIEDQLKGKKDDDLFAQFKTQRDKFVAMYETAREEYLKSEAAQVKAKDANGKQANNKNAAKNGESNEKIPSTNTSVKA